MTEGHDMYLLEGASCWPVHRGVYVAMAIGRHPRKCCEKPRMSRLVVLCVACGCPLLPVASNPALSSQSCKKNDHAIM